MSTPTDDALTRTLRSAAQVAGASLLFAVSVPTMLVLATGHADDGSLFDFDSDEAADIEWFHPALGSLILQHRATAAVLIEHELSVGADETGESDLREYVYLLGDDGRQAALARALVTRDDDAGAALVGQWDEMYGEPATEAVPDALRQALAQVARMRRSGCWTASRERQS